jgi:hypothetical protein
MPSQHGTQKQGKRNKNKNKKQLKHRNLILNKSKNLTQAHGLKIITLHSIDICLQLIQLACLFIKERKYS